MNNDKQKISDNFGGKMASSKKFLKCNRDLNGPRKEDLSIDWLCSNTSVKCNLIVGSNGSSHKASEGNSFEGIIEPGSRKETTSTKSYEDTNDIGQHFSKRKVNQHVDSAVSSSDSLIRDVFRQLMEDLMSYEVEAGKLHGRIRELTNENEKIQNRYTLMCRAIVGDMETLDEPAHSLDSEEFYSDDETYTSDGADVNDRSELIEKGVNHRENGIIVSSGKYSYLKQQLNLLESRVLESFEKLASNQLPSKEMSPVDLENMGIDLEEMPLVKNLRNALNRSSEELKKVRKFTDIRVSNLKSLLTSERRLSTTVQQELQEGKKYMRRASDFYKSAQSSIGQYKLKCETQQNVIESLKRQLTDVQKNCQNMNIDSGTNQNESDYNEILERYHQVLTAYTVLNSMSQKQKSDISILHHLCEEEKRKCLSLTDIVEQQRKSMNPIKLIGSASQSEALSKLSELYEKRCEESAKEERIHQARMEALHETYKKLLEQAEREHQSLIEDLVEELNKWRNTKTQKHDPSCQTEDTFNIDEMIANSDNN